MSQCEVMLKNEDVPLPREVKGNNTLRILVLRFTFVSLERPFVIIVELYNSHRFGKVAALLFTAESDDSLKFDSNFTICLAKSPFFNGFIGVVVPESHNK